MLQAGIRSLVSLVKAAGMAISSPRPKQFGVTLGGILSFSWVLGLELSLFCSQHGKNLLTGLTKRRDYAVPLAAASSPLQEQTTGRILH